MTTTTKTLLLKIHSICSTTAVYIPLPSVVTIFPQSQTKKALLLMRILLLSLPKLLIIPSLRNKGREKSAKPIPSPHLTSTKSKAYPSKCIRAGRRRIRTTKRTIRILQFKTTSEVVGLRTVLRSLLRIATRTQRSL